MGSGGKSNPIRAILSSIRPWASVAKLIEMFQKLWDWTQGYKKDRQAYKIDLNKSWIYVVLIPLYDKCSTRQTDKRISFA